MPGFLWRETLDLRVLWKESESHTGSDLDNWVRTRGGPEVGKRIRTLKCFTAELKVIAEQFDDAMNHLSFNEALESLYAWGDYSHRLWIATVI